MKKITFIVFALISGFAFGQTSGASASGDATASADIVSPITISDGVTDLNFGKIIKDAAGGTVTIAVNGDRSGTAPIVTASAKSAAEFTVNASENYTYSVNLPSDGFLIKNAGGAQMELSSFNHNLGTTPTGTGADQTLNVGATLTVNANQAEGNYSGTMTVTVAYQ